MESSQRHSKSAQKADSSDDDLNIVDVPEEKEPKKKTTASAATENTKGVNPLGEDVNVVDGQDGAYTKFAIKPLPPHKNFAGKHMPKSEKGLKSYYLTTFFISCI